MSYQSFIYLEEQMDHYLKSTAQNRR